VARYIYWGMGLESSGHWKKNQAIEGRGKRNFALRHTPSYTQLKTKDPYLSRMVEASKFALHRSVSHV
jgi:hypothetical protein